MNQVSTVSLDLAKFIHLGRTSQLAEGVANENRARHFSPDRIAGLQSRRLRRLLADAVAQSPFYRDKYGFTPDQFPIAYGAYQRLVSLPLSPKFSDGDVADVIGDHRFNRHSTCALPRSG